MLWSIKINSELHYCCLLCYLLVCIYLAATDDNGRRFGHHCPRLASNYFKIQEINRNNSLPAIDAHERRRFNKLRGTVVSCRVCIRSQSLIAR
jgi:hypothetical protein